MTEQPVTQKELTLRLMDRVEDLQRSTAEMGVQIREIRDDIHEMRSPLKKGEIHDAEADAKAKANKEASSLRREVLRTVYGVAGTVATLVTMAVSAILYFVNGGSQ